MVTRKHRVTGLIAVAASSVSLFAVAGGPWASAQSTAPGSDLSGEVVVQNWQAGNFPNGKGWQTIDDAFRQAHPGVTLVDEGMPFDQWQTTYQTAFATQSGADVFFMLAPGYLMKFAPALVDLSSRITPEKRAQLTGWDSVTDVNDPAMPIYGLPYNVDGQMWYYNKAAFKAAGLDPEKPPTTFEEMVAACGPLKAAGFIPYGGGGKNGAADLYAVFWPLMASAADARALGDGHMPWTDPKVKATAQLVLDLWDSGCLDPAWPSTDNNAEAVTAWQDGKVGMIEHYMGYVPQLKNPDDMGEFQLQSAKGSQRQYYPLGTSVGFSIPTWSPNQDAAWAYIDYVTSKEAEQTRLDIDGIGPTNTEVDLTNAKPDMKFMYDVAKGQPIGSFWGTNIPTALGDQFGKELVAVITGQKTLDEALQTIQTAAEEAQ